MYEPLEIADECSHQATKARQRGQHNLASLLDEASEWIHALVEEVEEFERMEKLGITRQDTMPDPMGGMY